MLSISVSSSFLMAWRISAFIWRSAPKKWSAVGGEVSGGLGLEPG